MSTDLPPDAIDLGVHEHHELGDTVPPGTYRTFAIPVPDPEPPSLAERMAEISVEATHEHAPRPSVTWDEMTEPGKDLVTASMQAVIDALGLVSRDDIPTEGWVSQEAFQAECDISNSLRAQLAEAESKLEGRNVDSDGANPSLVLQPQNNGDVWSTIRTSLDRIDHVKLGKAKGERYHALLDAHAAGIANDVSAKFGVPEVPTVSQVMERIGATREGLLWILPRQRDTEVLDRELTAMGLRPDQENHADE